MKERKAKTQPTVNSSWFLTHRYFDTDMFFFIAAAIWGAVSVTSLE